LAHFTNDVDAVRMASGMALVALIDGVFMTLAILIILLSKNVRLTLITVSPLPLITFFIVLFGKKVGTRFQRVQEGFANLSSMAQESIAGIRVLKTFVQERHFTDRFREKNLEYSMRHLSLVRIWGVFFPFITFLSGITTIIFILLGGRAVMEGTFSPGDFTAFLAYLEMMIWPMIGAGWTINLIQRAGASLGRINRILEEQPDITSPSNAITVIQSGDIEFRDLSYGYPDSVAPVLERISLHIPAGSSAGFLGRTGSGKSTLVKLIPRLLDPPPGTIFIGGRDIRSYDLKTLRSFIGMVSQDGFLFSTSIEENIAIGRRGWQLEEIERAADISTISRDLSSFPAGLKTVVGERGITLSGGQKQRITISRALLIEPRILVLDDCLSSVDTETEDVILRNLRETILGKTVIIISHRVSTLKLADRVFVLDKGKIIQQGTHTELIGIDGFYQDVYNIQQLARNIERPAPGEETRDGGFPADRGD
ncbi:MAG TPA: ABC transporter ATP-binding protein, partial [Spirochaetia bacterium]|nr:ABC transporter ATP-binding protein [Spirochaetia bacterium]